MTSSAKGLILLGASVALMGGCVVVTTANIYDVCSGTEQCPGTTTCQVANLTTDGFNGTFCTYGCVVDSDCPSDGFAPAVCESGQCYAGCPSGSGCPYAETCATDGSVFFCVP